MSEIIEKIKKCKSEKELNSLRAEVIKEAERNGIAAFEAARKAFKRQRRICRKNDKNQGLYD